MAWANITSLLLQMAIISSLLIVGDTSCFGRRASTPELPAVEQREEARPVLKAFSPGHGEESNIQGVPPGRSLGVRWLRGMLCGCFPLLERDQLSSHKLWAELDTRDELERVRLSLSTLSEVAAEQQLRDGSERLDDVIEIRGMDGGGLHFPTNITLRSIQDVFHQLQMQRQHLHVDSFQAILSGVQPLLSAAPNVVVLPSKQQVTVVGDIHGSLQDLAKIFEQCGWPGPGNTFIFNGDFVDRGDKGVEVIATLFALKIAQPEHVHLNRGNHEDEHIGRAYGFFEEVPFFSPCSYNSSTQKHVYIILLTYSGRRGILGSSPVQISSALLGIFRPQSNETF